MLFPSPADLSDPGIELKSPAFQADSLPLAPPGKDDKADFVHGRLPQWGFVVGKRDRTQF